MSSENPCEDTQLFPGKVSLIELIILLLTVHWLLSFFSQSIFPGIPHSGSFIYMLSVLIVLLIIMKVLT